MRIGILGGGLTGLTTAMLLGRRCEVLEKEATCGGLCRSLEMDGFTFDYGGAHIIFSQNKELVYFMQNVLGENWVRNRRNNKVFFKDRFVKYPFENGLSDLPKEEIFECLYYYLRNDSPPPSNFLEWLYYTFGRGIAERYLIPYNRKIWKYDLELMSAHWVEGRIPKPPLEDIIKSAIGIETEGYIHQLYFIYPKYGGIQSLVRVMEERIPCLLRNFEVRKIKRVDDKWMVSNGEVERFYDKLVSTIPIFDLISSLEGVPDDVLKAAGKLRYNSLITIMIGLNTSCLNDFTAVYFPNEDFKPHRVGFPMNFSPFTVPSGKSSLVAEISTNMGDETWKMDDEELIEHVVEWLDEKGIISKRTVCFSHMRRIKYAYVVYDRDYLSNIKTIKEYVVQLGIELCGRFAEFEYLNMDECVKRGLAMARKLL